MPIALVQAKPILIKASSYDAGRSEEVKKFVIDEVTGLGRAASRKLLHRIYGIVVADDRYLSKLKIRLENHLKNKYHSWLRNIRHLKLPF